MSRGDLMNAEEALRVVSGAASPDQPLYLVGGAVRDRVLGREVHDLDFTTQANTRQLARLVADRLEGGFYPLDEERGTYRVVAGEHAAGALVLDFASLRGTDLLADLKARDFAINAMAIELRNPDVLIDPCGGQSDLKLRQLRACSPTSVLDDPVRALRGLRLATALRLTVAPDTLAQVKQAAGLLGRISSERLRDEFCRILESARTAQALRLLDECGLMATLLPDLNGLRGLVQSPPHVYEGWTHTLVLIERLEQLWDCLVDGRQAEGLAENDAWLLGLAQSALGRFQKSMAEHYAQKYVPMRGLRSAVLWGGLFHDCAKPLTRTVDPDGRIRFFTHDEIGAQIAARQAQAFAMSNQEIERIHALVAGHMRVHLMADDVHGPSARAIYRYFRDTQPAGIDICLLSLADTWATYGPALNTERWQAELRCCQMLGAAYWEQREAAVAPPRLINGNDLIQVLGLRPGPQIGQILEAVREAQVTGQVSTREGALDLARQMMNEG